MTFDFSELSKLININSYTKNKDGVDKNGQIYINLLENLEYVTKVYKNSEIGNHLHFKSKKNHPKTLLLLGHIDTVFPPMSFENFTEDEHWIYGPGVCDMKGGNIIAIEALKNVKRDLKEINNIDMLLVSDEETGSDNSKFLTTQLAKDYDYCLVFEAAGKNGEVVEKRKGVGTFFIDITGKAAHAGNCYKDGINANLEAANKLIKLTNLTDLAKGTTVNVGKIEGGIGANTISPNSKLTLELRYTSADERDRVLKELHNITHNSDIEGIESVLSGGIQRDVMDTSQKKKEFIKDLEKIIGEPLLLESRGGVSDANTISAAGVITLDGFGPFGDGDHTVHERASKQSFDERLEMVTKILKHFSEYGDFK